MDGGLLLDTCAAIWMANGDHLSDESSKAIERAAIDSAIFVSPISAWEIATLVRKGRIALTMPPESWFDALLRLPGIRLAPMSPRMLISSAFLPGSAPSDPADRILVASARSESFVLVTRDRHLLTYGGQGHVRVLAC